MKKCGCLEGFCTNRCDMDIVDSYFSDKVQVSSCGMVWRVKKGELHRITPYETRGIFYVSLECSQKRLAEIVLRSFGVHGQGVISYLDEDPKNCKLTNLKWSRNEK